MPRLSRLLPFLQRVWVHLPLGGEGLGPGGSPFQRRARRIVAAWWWRFLPAWLALPVRLAARLLWLPTCPMKAAAAARRSGLPAASRPVASAILRGWFGGMSPDTTLLLAAMGGTVAGSDAALIDDATGLTLWRMLGDPEQARLLSDKRAAAELFAARGIATPPILAETDADGLHALAAFLSARRDPFFAKPRHGSRGRRTSVVRPLPGGLYAVNDGPPVDRKQVTARLLSAPGADPMLIQPFLEPGADTRDLSPHAPATLRITTVRALDGPAQVLGTFLRVNPPGRWATVYTTGALIAPVEPRGRHLLEAMLLDKPAARFASVPWNGAPVEGRKLADLEKAEAMALAAADIFTGLPVIGWDVLLSSDGPMLLEGNTGLSWWLMHVVQGVTNLPSPLPGLLESWLDRAERCPPPRRRLFRA